MHISNARRIQAIKNTPFSAGDVVYIVSSDGVVSGRIVDIRVVVDKGVLLDKILIFDDVSSEKLGFGRLSYYDFCYLIYHSEDEARVVYSSLVNKTDTICSLKKLVIIRKGNSIIKLRVNSCYFEGIYLCYSCENSEGVKFNVYANEVNNHRNNRLVASNKDEALEMLKIANNNSDVSFCSDIRFLSELDVLSLISIYAPDLKETLSRELRDLCSVRFNLRGSELLFGRGVLYDDNNEPLKLSDLYIDIERVRGDVYDLDDVISLSFEDTMGFFRDDFEYSELGITLKSEDNATFNIGENVNNSSVMDSQDTEVVDYGESEDLISSVYSSAYKYEGN